MPGVRKLRVETRSRVWTPNPHIALANGGRVGEGRPTLYTPELANRLADHIAEGLTDEEAAALEDIFL